MSTWAITGLALAFATLGAGIVAAAWLLFRHETEESPAARRAALARVSARARAQSPAPPPSEPVRFEQLHPGRVWEYPPSQATFESAILGGRQVFENEQGAILTAPPGAMKGAPTGFRELSVDEMRERIVELRRQPLTRSRPLDLGEGRRRVVEFAGIPVVTDETVERGTLELRFGCTRSRHFVGGQATSCECGALLVEDLGDGSAVSLVGISVQPQPWFTLAVDEVRRSVQAELAEQELARRRAQSGGDAA